MVSEGISFVNAVPTIDLSLSEDVVVPQIAAACSTYGFFLVLEHGVEETPFREQMRSYFHGLDPASKRAMKRHQCNARGYFDDELTKQKRDWKECLDVGVPGSRDWNLDDENPGNKCLDGINQLPSREQLPEFRDVVVEYFEACAALSKRLAFLMAKGLGFDSEDDPATKHFLQQMEDHHTSYLRMNHYPPCQKQDVESNGDPSVLGISPHRDAGFLTVLLQDDDCHSLQVWSNDEWVTVHPLPNSLTINTGDMCMIWSNGKYQAPLHRVLTNHSLERYSAPFFYNPGYETLIQPVMTRADPETNDQRLYHPCLWGYFRAVRFAGDLTNLGVEIQTEDYLVGEGGNPSQMEKQRLFAEQAEFSEPFSVEKYRGLLQG